MSSSGQPDSLLHVVVLRTPSRMNTSCAEVVSVIQGSKICDVYCIISPSNLPGTCSNANFRVSCTSLATSVIIMNSCAQAMISQHSIGSGAEIAISILANSDG